MLTTFVPFLTPYPSWVKVAVVVTAFSALVTLIGLIFAAPSNSDGNGGGPKIENHNISSQNQSGGITAHTVNK